MNILLHGCNGRMGQVITRLACASSDLKIVCGVDSYTSGFNNSYPVYNSLEDVNEKVDVLIDFSNHSTLDALLDFGCKNNIGLILCTTGYTIDEKQNILKASEVIPIFNSGNMSLGINLLLSLAKQAAEKLYGDFDIEIIEKHHNQKLDAPSGTALMIADAINSAISNNMDYSYERHSKMEKRNKKEIGIHSLRGGAIIGEHNVVFAGAGEVIEISHSAISRDVFGVGALRAAQFIIDKPAGLYNMQNLIEG
jgi:4-hydroxy-tetrahydrodipicolinate reductase